MNEERSHTGRLFLATLLGGAIFAGLWALIAPGGGNIAHAQYEPGTPTIVSAFGCIDPFGSFGTGGHVSRPAGSLIVIRQGYSSGAVGGVRAFLGAETTAVSVNDGLMVDVSDAWVEVQQPKGGLATVTYPTGVTLHNPGDTMRFTFALVFNRPLTDPSDYDGDGRFDPQTGAKGLAFGGTCTVTAGP